MVCAWLVLAAFVAYAVSGSILAGLLGQSLTVVPIWSHANTYPAWGTLVALAFGLSGLAIALVVPTLAWVRALSTTTMRAAPWFHRAFATNLVQAIAFISLWKAVEGVVPPRAVFIGWQALVAIIGLGLLWRRRVPRVEPSRDRTRVILVGAFALLVCLPLFFWGKVAIEDGSDDGTEQFEFSRSLATHQLPYWDLENGYYGFYPSFMLFAYPTELSFIALGETEAAQRLPVFVYLFGIYLVLAELIRRRRRALSWAEIALLAGAATTFLLYHSIHSTYEVVADMAEPTGVDTFFTFLAAAAFYELSARQRWWWGVFASFGAAALAAGVPFALLFLFGRLVSHWRGLRWSMLRSHVLDALAFVAPFAVYRALVAVYTSLHPLGATKWSLERIFEQYPIRFDVDLITTVVSTWAVGVAVVPLLGFALLARRDRLARALGIAIVGYLGTLIFFSRTNSHYLIPLCLFPAVLLLRGLAARDISVRVRTAVWSGYGVALAVLLAIAVPLSPRPHTAYRDFGARTLMLYDSYPDAVIAAEHLVTNRPGIYLHLPHGKPVRLGEATLLALAPNDPSEEPIYREGVIDHVVTATNAASTQAAPWGLLHHIWVRYADRVPSPGRRYHQVLAAPHLAPAVVDGFVRRELPHGWVLFYRPGESIFTWLGAPPPR